MGNGLVYTADMAKKGISEQIEAYGRWRSDLQSAIERYRDWLAQSDAADASLNVKLSQIIERLHDTLLKVAFVAEFSRGKSELINAIFFAQYGQRVVPSSAGRTTMCPTELLYDASMPVGIRLLPIDTRLMPVPLAELPAWLAGLRTKGIKLRDATSFGLPGWVRLGVRAPASQQALWQALDSTTNPRTS